MAFKEDFHQIFVDSDDCKNVCSVAVACNDIVLAASHYQTESVTINEVAGTARNPVVISA